MVRFQLVIAIVRRHYFACNFTKAHSNVFLVYMYIYIYRESGIDYNKKGQNWNYPHLTNSRLASSNLGAWCSCLLLDDTLRPELSLRPLLLNVSNLCSGQ